MPQKEWEFGHTEKLLRFGVVFRRNARKMGDEAGSPLSLDDALGAWQNVAYYLGLSSRTPEFARFNYAENVEYWTPVWGMIVMAATGIMLRAEFLRAIVCRAGRSTWPRLSALQSDPGGMAR